MVKNKVLRRDFLKGLGTLPFLGFFAAGFHGNFKKEVNKGDINRIERLGINHLDAPLAKLIPSDSDISKKIRFGVIGHGWRGEQLLQALGYVHPEKIKRETRNGQYSNWLKSFLNDEDLNIEFAGVCDTFSIHAQRGYEISTNDIRPGGGEGKTRPAKIYPTYREMIESKDIDAVIIATPDHWHARMAIDAARAGKHVYLEKPVTQTIEEVIELRDTIKSTGVVFQSGHENRQQLSYRMARELYEKGALGTVSMVQTYTTRNGAYGAWIRKRQFDDLGNKDNINWKEFLGHTSWFEFDPKRYFNWHRYSEYGTGTTGNDFSHQFDCINQILHIGIPDSVVATGGQYYYKNHGDMPDVFNASFNYPNEGLNINYNCSLVCGIYKEPYLFGSEATMYVDRGIRIYKNDDSEKYKHIKVDSDYPIYVYNPGADIDAVTSATAKPYVKGGYGSTFIDGKIVDATRLHLKEWFDAIRDQGETKGNIDTGFEEAVTFILANIAYESRKTANWDPVKEVVKLS